MVSYSLQSVWHLSLACIHMVSLMLGCLCKHFVLLSSSAMFCYTLCCIQVYDHLPLTFPCLTVYRVQHQCLLILPLVKVQVILW